MSFWRYDAAIRGILGICEKKLVNKDTMINGLFQLLLFQAAGELISKFLVPFIPGPVLGLVVLLTFLVWKGAVPLQIDGVGSAILQHLGLLFVPASVGVLMFLPVLKDHAVAVIGALVLSVMATIAVTASVLKILGTLDSGDDHAP
jgi:holin-like protein